MARGSKSQWDFGGELFRPAETRAVVSVSELTTRVKRALEGGFSSLWVRGEVSNLRLQASGHAYFVLKDAGSQVSCVLFRGQGGPQRAALQDGASVILGGELTVYEPRGQYQLRVTQVEAEGVGALQAAFERLKQKLAAEGLFDPARKRPLPAFPQCLGIVTSPTGAALQDVLHVIGRRYAALPVILAGVRVQGQGAAAEIARAIARLNAWAVHSGQGPDVILITRGGGSLEDLWAFNEEVVARAVAASELPVVSAVGHEIDFSISDFVADLRAATPSAAAELLTANYVAGGQFVAGAGERLRGLAHDAIARRLDLLEGQRRRLNRVHPRRLMEAQAQRLDELGERLRRVARAGLRGQRRRVSQVQQRLLAVRPAAVVTAARARLLELRLRLAPAARRRVERDRQRILSFEARLRLLSPQNVLERGYSISLDAETGVVLRTTDGLSPGRRLRTRLAQGEVTSVTTQVSNPAPAPKGAEPSA